MVALKIVAKLAACYALVFYAVPMGALLSAEIALAAAVTLVAAVATTSVILTITLIAETILGVGLIVGTATAAYLTLKFLREIKNEISTAFATQKLIHLLE